MKNSLHLLGVLLNLNILHLLYFCLSTASPFLLGEGLPKGRIENSEIIAPQDPKNPINVGELLCVELPSGESECGTVISSGSDIVRISVSGGETGRKPTEVKTEEVQKPKAKKEKKAKPSPTPSPFSSPIPSPIASPEPSPSPTPSPTPSPSPIAEAKKFEDLYANTRGQCMRELSSIGDLQVVEQVKSSPSQWHTAGGTTFALSFYNFYGRLEKSSSSQWDLGGQLTGAFGAVEEQTIKAFGLLLYTNYWDDSSRLGLVYSPGILLQHVGLSLASAGVTSSAFSVSPQMTVGIRMLVQKGFYFTPRAGALYAVQVSGDKEMIDFSGIHPFVSIEAGISF